MHTEGKQAEAAPPMEGGPRDSQPTELDHTSSFACSIASSIHLSSLRAERKGSWKRRALFIFSACFQCMRRWMEQRSQESPWEAGVAQGG